jgi:hypothetical protein
MKRFAAFCLGVVLCGPVFGQNETRFQSVVVKPGDTLWAIANHYLKDPSHWDEILKYNHLPSSDPTVALPGMVLRVPIRLIKERYRAARLIELVNRALCRRGETADWKEAALNAELFGGDALRTLEAARAKVRFVGEQILSLDPNSMAILRPPKADYDVELKSGGVFAGQARVVTVSARIVPKTKDAQYSAKVRADLSTLVEVYTGEAAVTAQGRTVDVPAGRQTEVKLGLSPGVPTKITDLPNFEARAAAFTGSQIVGEARVSLGKGLRLAGGTDADSINKAIDAAGLHGDVMSLSVGIPISAYRVQASGGRDFSSVLLDRTFDPDQRIDTKAFGLAPGVYWFRIALIDLLGVEGAFSAPRLYSIGLEGAQAVSDLKDSVVLIKPAKDEDVGESVYKVLGLLKRNGLTVSVNGKPVRRDGDGNFSAEIGLAPGDNDVVIVITDGQGNTETVTRRLTYRGR